MENDLLAAYTDILNMTYDDVPTEPKELVKLIAKEFGVEVTESAIREFVEAPFKEQFTGVLIEEEDKRIHYAALGYA